MSNMETRFELFLEDIRKNVKKVPSEIRNRKNNEKTVFINIGNQDQRE